MRALVPLIDADTRAFDGYLAAAGLPRDTPERAAARHAAMQDALKAAVEVPLSAMRIADGCWPAMLELAAHGNIGSRSDLEVGARALETGAWGAWRNVRINLEQLEDDAYRRGVEQEAAAIADRAARAAVDVVATLADRATPQRSASSSASASPAAAASPVAPAETRKA
jgi:glutamate formiminotransferase/formiminotetrahydrofolate cyclodeaminase